MVLPIVYYTDELIKKTSEKVEVFDDKLKAFISDMFETLEKANGIGLAAVQVGRLLRLFIVAPPDGKKYVFINPEIIETSQEVAPYNEGCLSLPNVYRDVVRPKSLTIVAQDENGKRFTLTADGILARIIFHENDHLDGKMFIDYLDENEKKIAIKKFKKRNKDILNKIKNG